MGSRSKIEEENNKAYIAGFLDGDGSLMLQIKKRKDGRLKLRFMPTICFYQDSRHDETLLWIREFLEIGYISKRNDGMTELRINGFIQVRDIMSELMPFIKFKKIQANALHKACDLLTRTKINRLTRKELLQLVELILVLQNENYVTKRKKSRDELLSMLGLTP